MNNVFLGRLTLQDKSTYGGSKTVFVKLDGQKNSYRPTLGGVIQNPPKNGGKMFQGDLVEYQIDTTGRNGKIYLLRTFEVNADVGSDDTTIQIVKNEYRHAPEVGMNIMVAPDTLATTGAAYAITAVTESSDGKYWTITIGTTLGAIAKGAILVEANGTGASGKNMLVQNPNAFLDVDAFFKMPTTNINENVIYSCAPVMHEIAWTSRLAPLPACVTAINKSKVTNWFEL